METNILYPYFWSIHTQRERNTHIHIHTDSYTYVHTQRDKYTPNMNTHRYKHTNTSHTCAHMNTQIETHTCMHIYTPTHTYTYLYQHTQLFIVSLVHVSYWYKNTYKQFFTFIVCGLSPDDSNYISRPCALKSYIMSELCFPLYFSNIIP